MYYDKEELEKMAKKAAEEQKRMEEESRGHKFESGAGIQIICTHCKNNHFHKGNAMLNTRGLTFFGLDWLNESATTLICSRCGYIHWFAKEVKKI